MMGADKGIWQQRQGWLEGSPIFLMGKPSMNGCAVYIRGETS